MEEKPVAYGLFERISEAARNSLGLKLFVMFFISLLLLIPVGMVKDVIRERESRKKEVITEVSSKWGGEQTIIGPVVTVPYKKYYKTAKGETRFMIEAAHLLPKTLSIKGSLMPEKRHRGIYEINVYNAALDIKGSFGPLDLGSLGIAQENISGEYATLTLAITDLRGIKNKVVAKVNGTEIKLDPGAHPEIGGNVDSGVTGKFKITPGGKYDFEVTLDLNGSEALTFAPAGEETTVEVSSPWPSPSFDGAFLPVDRKVSSSGFDAKWKVLYFNRNYPQSWTGKMRAAADRNDEYPYYGQKAVTYDTGTLKGSSFGVKLYTPLDVYHKTTRIAKYAMLFIVLTFAAFFFSEAIGRAGVKIRVHPVQYLLVGFALITFYSLLLSLSEHIGFSAAYSVSAAAVVAMISLYSLSVLKDRRLGALVCAMLVFLYGYFYVILLSEDYALLLGSVLIFASLGAVMYLTRKMDWYAAKLGRTS